MMTMDAISANSDLSSLDISTLNIEANGNGNSSIASETCPGTSTSSQVPDIGTSYSSGIPATNSSPRSPSIRDIRHRRNSSSASITQSCASSSSSTNQSSTSFLYPAFHHQGLEHAFKHQNLWRKLINIAFPYKDWMVDIVCQKDASGSNQLVLIYSFEKSHEISAPQRERLTIKVKSVLVAQGIEDVDVIVDLNDPGSACTRPDQPSINYDLENLAQYGTEDFPMVGANIGQGDSTGTLSGYVSIDGPCAGRYALTCNHVVFLEDSRFQDEAYLSSPFKTIAAAENSRTNKDESKIGDEGYDADDDNYDYYDEADKRIDPITYPSNYALRPQRDRLIQQYAAEIESLPDTKNDPKNVGWPSGCRWRTIFESMMYDDELVARGLTPHREFPRGEEKLRANPSCAKILKKARRILPVARPLGEVALGSGCRGFNEEQFDWSLIKMDRYRFGKDQSRAKNILPPVDLSEKALAAFDAGLPDHLHLSATLDTSSIHLSNFRTKAQIEEARATADESRLRVLKFGARSGWTAGTINIFPSHHWASVRGSVMQISVLGLVEEEDFGLPGDSGSLVFDRFGEVVGVLFSGSGQFGGRTKTYLMPMESLLEDIKWSAYASRAEMDWFDTEEQKAKREAEWSRRQAEDRAKWPFPEW